MPPEPLLSFERVSYRYPDADRAALDAVELRIFEGELVVLAGASASGKSTLLRAAAALVPHFHGGEFGGRVVAGGLDTRNHGPADISAVASSVFQDPEAQAVMTGVAAEIALPLECRGADPVQVARAVEETAVALGIEGLLERPLHSLSGGELQRVALAAALVTQPRLLLLDEPTSQLDPVAGDELVWQLRRLNEEWGTTVLIAEHRLERFLPAADRVVVLDRGVVACDAPPRRFLEWAAKHEPELSPPAARMFALAGFAPPPLGVKDARAALRRLGVVEPVEASAEVDVAVAARPRRRRFARASRTHRPPPALEAERLWVEYDDGSGAGIVALRGLDVRIEHGETVALVGRNGAGKSTLLRAAAGIARPSRGRVRAAGDVALVVQTPSDYFLHEAVRDELPRASAAAALAELGLEALAARDPHDLSGGERQRLALAIVLAGRGIGGGDPPALVALDEPTRGMDRARKRALGERIATLAAAGAAVIVATHDVEFAALATARTVMLGRGRVVADGATRDLLSGGRYFATEVARVLGPAARAVLPEQGAALLAAAAPPERRAGAQPRLPDAVSAP